MAGALETGRRIALVGVALALVAGCQGANGDGRAAPVPEGPDEIALGPDREPAGDGASLSGVLAPEAGCVYIAADDLGTVLPVFPRDVSRWDGTTLFLGGARYRAGDAIVMGGGFRDLDLFDLDEVAVHVPEGCRTDTVFAVS